MNKDTINKEYDKLLQLGDIMNQQVKPTEKNGITIPEFVESVDKTGKEYLDEEDVDKLLEVLDGVKSNKAKKIDSLPGNNPLKPVSEEYKQSIEDSKALYGDGEYATVMINPQTGGSIAMAIGDGETRIDDESTIIDLFEEKKYEIGTDEDKQALIDTGLSEDDAVELLSILIDYEKDKSIKIYDRLPQSIKMMIMNTAPDEFKYDKKAKEMFAKDMIEHFRSEIIIDKEFTDLQTSLANEMQFPDLISSYTLHIKNIMEVELISKADEVQEQNPELANRLRKISETYKDTYTFKRIINKINNKSNIKRELDKQIKDYPKIVKKFSAKYAHSKFTIDSVALVIGTLDRHIDREKYKYETLLKFVILFCNICKGYNTSDPFEHTYMYYTIKNILSLDNVSAKDTDFYKEIIENISSVLDLLQ